MLHLLSWPFAAVVWMLMSPAIHGGVQSVAPSPAPVATTDAHLLGGVFAGACGITFSADGATAYFGAKTPSGAWGIMISRFVDGVWTNPEPAPFCSGNYDGAPQMTPGGTRLFFASTRPALGRPADDRYPAIWYVDRQGDSWGEPHPLGSDGLDHAVPLALRAGLPSPAADGTVYYFRVLDANGERVRMVRSKPVNGRYLDFEDLGDIINGVDDGSWDPAIAPDQSFLVFSNFKRSDRYGDNDLYISHRNPDGGWSEPRNLGPRVNTNANEVTPSLSPDGRTLYFYRNGIRRIPLAACEGVRMAPEAQLFEEGVISTPDSFAATFTPDGQTMYFCRSAGERPNRSSTIMVSHRDGNTWAPPQPVPFSGEFNDFDPMLSPDGAKLFFSSVRPETGPRPTLWVVEQTTAGNWGTPRHLATVTGADGVAVFPCPTANGNLYFAGHRSGLASQGDDDIYVCRRQADGSYAAPENLGPAINSPSQDYDAYVAPDESFLIFCSRRPGGIGPSDFYISVRENGVWTPARNLGPKINSATSPGICCPAVSPDREWFYFTSGRDGRRGIYRIEFQALGLAASVTTASDRETAQRATDGLVAATLEPVLFGDGAVKGCSPTFSPDGETVFTHLYTATKGHTILVSHFRDGRWTESVVAPFSGVFDEMEPAFSADGACLFFASERPLDGKRIGMQIWVVHQTATGWSEPGLVGGKIAAPPSESGVPSLARDGSLTFARIDDGGWPWGTLLQSRWENGAYTAPVRLNDAINPGGRSWSHTIAPDQSFLIFAGVIDAETPRPDSLGDIDLYVSFRVNGEWQPGVNLGPTVNTAEAEVWPRISPNGRSLFFNRQGPNARGIYQIDLEPLLAPLRSKPTPQTRATVSADGKGFAAGVGIPEPEPVAEAFPISGAAVAQSVTFTPDGNEFYFVTGEGDRTVIKECRRTDTRWSEPVVASFVGADNVETPSLSPDGTTIFFAGPERDIWAAGRSGNGWNAPRKLDRAINSESWESSPSAAANGSLYFVSGRAGRGQVFRSSWENGRHLAAEKLGDEVNQHRVQELFVAPDESYLLFGARPAAGDRDDIFISFRSGESWTSARKVGPAVNSAAYEGRPSVSPDGQQLYFTRRHDNGPGIMRVEWPRLLARLRAEVLSAGPADAPRSTSTDIPVEFWQLPTGSRIAYLRFPASNPNGAIPFVFLHGGPGGYAVGTYASARAACERLAQRGFDVYLYDQIGSGFSNRLADPTEYTLDRHVADLEAIRRQIGGERMILLGASHGATLAANYLAAHPGRVEKVIFVSPGALDPAEHKDEVYSYPTLQLSPCFLRWIRDTRGVEAARRYQRFDTLLRRDVRAAYQFAGDTEMDSLADAWTLERLLPQGVRDPSRLPTHVRAVSGMGWWVGEMTCWDEVHRTAGVRAKLASCDVPALILRGDADFLPAVFADEYAATFRRSKLVRIPNAGHLIDVDQPEAYRAAIKAFLFGENDSSHAFD